MTKMSGLIIKTKLIIEHFNNILYIFEKKKSTSNVILNNLVPNKITKKITLQFCLILWTKLLKLRAHILVHQF